MARSSIIHENIYDSIVKKVLSGKIASGTRLVERDLAEELGVSRIPIREVLTRLIGQGLLTGGKDGQGAWIRKYSSGEIRELYFFRGVIEGGIVRLAAQTARSDNLETASIYCDQMEDIIDQTDFRRWSDLDYKFHLCLAQAGGNQRLINAVEMLLSESHYLFYRHSAHKPALKTSEDALAHKQSVLCEHRKLVKLILQGDGDGAETMVRNVMIESANRICRAMIANEMNKVAE